MKLASFHTGLHLTLNEIPYRIEKILEPQRCYLERVSDGEVVIKSKLELLTFHEEGLLEFYGQSGVKKNNNNFENRNSLDLCAMTEEKKRIIYKRYEYVKEACRILGETPTKINMDEVIKRTVERIDDQEPPCIYTVYRWWKRWTNGGKDLMSLANLKTGKAGHRCFKGIVNDEILRVIDEVYLTKQKNTMQHAFDELVYRITQLNNARLDPIKIPSRATFYRRLKSIDKYEVLAAREGKRVADSHFRVTGAGVVNKHILERVEVDHTPLDVIVFNEKTGLADGRPTLTLLLDRYSRMPLGFEIGFEVPSELSVMRALRHSIISKTYVKKTFPEIQNDWPVYGVPSTLVCDNGLEFHSHQLRRMCMELNIELQFCPKRQPNYKGAIERYIGTINRSVSHKLPGTTFSNIQKRGDYDSIKEVRITIKDLKCLIHMWIIDIYCQQVHRTTQRTPIGLWREGLNIVEPMVPESLSQLNLILTREAKRTLTHKGIEFSGLFYNSSELGLLRKRSYETYEISIRHDPEDIGSIWVYDEMNQDYICVPCITSEYADGVTIRQHKEIRKDARSRGNQEQDEAALLESKARFNRKIEDLSRDKLLRERKKAARHNIENVGNELNVIEKNINEIDNDDWSTDEILLLKTSERER
jgi:putative transposase